MKGTPTRRQSQARRDQRGLRDNMSAWRETRRTAALKRLAERRKANQKEPKPKPEPSWLVKHTDWNHRDRRELRRSFGRMPRSTNQPYVNPDKDRRLAGKARRNARRAAR